MLLSVAFTINDSNLSFLAFALVNFHKTLYYYYHRTFRFEITDASCGTSRRSSILRTLNWSLFSLWWWHIYGNNRSKRNFVPVLNSNEEIQSMRTLALLIKYSLTFANGMGNKFIFMLAWSVNAIAKITDRMVQSSSRLYVVDALPFWDILNFGQTSVGIRCVFDV